MGRAMVRQPQVFLFDEPLSNLDAKLRVSMRTEIKALHQRLQTTSIYVTHDQIEAMTMADQIVVMHDGRIEQIGSPMDLYDRPANLFVAGFIGSPAMNLWPGQVRLSSGFCAALEGGGTLALDEALAPHVTEGQSVTVGVRPEHLELSDHGLALDILVVEPTGAQTLVTARAGKAEVSAVFQDRPTLKPGDRIHVRPRQMHLFDGGSQQRLG